MNLALGNYTGIEKLNVSSSHTGVNYIVNNEDELGQFCYLNKGDILMENLIPNNRIINLVKIDVEEFEMFVLQGFAYFLKNKIIQTLQIEITDEYLIRVGSSKEQVFNYMKSFGYLPRLNSSESQYNEIFELNNVLT